MKQYPSAKPKVIPETREALIALLEGKLKSLKKARHELHETLKAADLQIHRIEKDLAHLCSQPPTP